MTKLNVFASFAVIILSSVLLANGMYSNQIFAIEAQNENNHDQNGNLNESEINANIEQENKCKKDTECENENEINNQLSITTITQAQQEQQPETSQCETCFTDNLTEEEITDLFDFAGEGPSTLEGLCQFIEENIQDEDAILGFSAFLLAFADFHPTVTEDDVNNILDCLEEVFGVTFPRTV